jgi:hypothetical protein
VESNQINNPDELFRKKIDDPISAGPVGDWSSLDKELKAHFAEKKRRRFIFFLIPLLAGGIAWMIFSEEAQPFSHSASGNARETTLEKKNGVVLKDQAATKQNPALPENTTENGRTETITPVAQNTIGGEQRSLTMQQKKHPSGTVAKIKPTKQKNSKKKSNVSPSTVAAITKNTGTEEEISRPLDEPVSDTSSANVSQEQKQTVKPKTKKPASVAAPEEEEATDEKFSWVDIHAGMNRTMALLSGDPGQPGYMQKRKKEERAAIYPAVGIDFRFNIGNYLGSIGILLASYGDEYAYSDSAMKRIYFGPGGYKDSMIHDQDFPGEGKNKFTYIEFPVQVGYRFPTKGKLGVSVVGGLAMGFLTASKAHYIDTALTGNYFFTNHYIQIFTERRFSVLMNPSVEYRLTNGSEFYISLPVRYQFNSILHEQRDIRQKYLSAGLHIGYRIYTK